jgi:hypothetical protein
MRARIAVLSLSVFLSGAVSSAQNAPQAAPAVPQVDFSTVNCSGFISQQRVPEELWIVSGEQSNYKVTFANNDLVYINRGQDKGVRVGDRFSVVRPDWDSTDVPWFKWQTKLLKAMGQLYRDAGQIQVVNVQPKVSVAQVIFSCGYMQRGDILLPYEERPTPPLKDPAAFDHYAPPTGKPVAMVVAGKDYGQVFGKLSAVYVNLGANQGVRVGDYFRIFRYQGSMAEMVPQNKGYQYSMYGFGSAHARYEWNDLPREVIGEGVVINVNRNSSTMVITVSSIEVYAGDYVEIE